MDFGRVVCVLIATRSGQVIYERFYVRLSEAEKADIRLGLDAVSQHWLEDTPEEAERVGRYKYGDVVMGSTPEEALQQKGNTSTGRERWCLYPRKMLCSTHWALVNMKNLHVWSVGFRVHTETGAGPPLC